MNIGEPVPELPRVLTVRKYVLFLCLVLTGLSTPGTVLAQDFCSEPVAPYCVDKDSEFDTMLQVTRCEEDLTNYREQLDEYEECIADQLESLRAELKDARKVLDEAKEDF